MSYPVDKAFSPLYKELEKVEMFSDQILEKEV
jgi:hypothetical protein